MPRFRLPSRKWWIIGVLGFVLLAGLVLELAANAYFIKIEKEGNLKVPYAVATARVRIQHDIDGLELLFPDANLPPSGCYQAALSNYVEDQWNRIAQEYGCLDPDKVCVGPQSVSSPWMLYLLPYFWGKDMRKFLVHQSNTDFIYKKLTGSIFPALSTMRVMSYPTMPQQPTKTPEQMQARINEIELYIANCATLKPAPWADVGHEKVIEDMPVVAGEQTAMKLGVYGSVVLKFMGSALPKDKQSYVLCINNLEDSKLTAIPCNFNKACIEAVPVETREALRNQLIELAAHQCDLTYAQEMAQRGK